jgi:predicted amidohydrolase YtcJ
VDRARRGGLGDRARAAGGSRVEAGRYGAPLADLIVLDQNVTKVPLDDISETHVLMTMVGGKRVWEDPAF